MSEWQEKNEHAQRLLNEPCPFCHQKTAELWYDPSYAALCTPYQVRCRTCQARGPRCDCGEESAVPMWLSVLPHPEADR